MQNQIEEKRKEVNRLCVEGKIKECLKASQELDKLIIQDMRICKYPEILNCYDCKRFGCCISDSRYAWLPNGRVVKGDERTHERKDDKSCIKKEI